MPSAPSSRTDAEQAETESWPWHCLSCGETIFHVDTYCRDCTKPHRRGSTRRRESTASGFLDWIRQQSVLALSLKVTVIAGVELALTTLWLQILLYRAGALDHVALI